LRQIFMTSTVTTDELRNLTAADGWLRDGEGELLFRLARSCQGRGAIVEIGSWKGKSTIWLAKGSMASDSVKVWAVDPHTGSEALGRVNTFEEFKRNIMSAGLGEMVTPIVQPSQEAAAGFKAPIELIFIDGAHDYASARADFDAWFPKVVDGGTVAFHDVLDPACDGPRRVVLECVCSSRKFGGVRLVRSIAYAAKVIGNSTRERAQNRMMGCVIGRSVFLRGALPKPIWGLGCKVARGAGIIS
jgi:MMP 1-O-methyltransferase